MVMHACQIGPTDTTPFARDRLTRPALGQGNALRQANFLSLFLLSLLGAVGATTLSHVYRWLWCYCLPSEVDVDVDQPGPSSSTAGLLAAN